MRLAEFIFANIDHILARWDEFARSVWPEGLAEQKAVRNDAEEMLRAIAADMGVSQTASEQSAKSMGRQARSVVREGVDRPSASHGSSRSDHGLSLPAVIAEYRALRASVIRLWTEHASSPSPTDLDDLTRFNESIDQSLTEAVLHYMRRSEKRVQESENRFRTLADAAPAILWVTNRSGQCTFLSRGWVEYTGQPEQESLGMGWLKMIHPQDVDRATETFLAANEAKEGFSYFCRLRRADGEYRWAIDAGRPRFGDSAEFLGFVGSVIDVHDRKTSEFALLQTEARMNLVRRSTGVGFWYCDLPFGVLQWDENVKAHFHLPADAQVTIDTFYERIHPEDREPTRVAIDAAIRNRSVYDVDYRTCDPVTGAVHWVRAIGQVYTSPEGDPIRFDGVTVDFTHRKHAEDAVRRSAESFAAMVERSPLGIYTVDSQFRVRHVSTGAQPVFENVRPLIGRDLAEVMRTIWPEAMAEEFINIFRRVIKHGETYVSPGLTAHRRDTNQLESYEWQVNPVRMDDGEDGAVCYFFDATRIQQAHESLRASERRFRMIADNMGQLAWTCDELGSLTWCNKRCLDYFGVPAELMMEEGWMRALQPEDVNRVRTSLERSRKSGEIWEDTFRLRGADGKYRWFLSRAYPIRDDFGTIVRWFGTNTDVTELRTVQAELEDHRVHLERLVQERTMQLEETHRQLRISERLAALGTLSAGLGHDMGNLLVPMRIRLESLLHADLPEASRGDVDAIRTSVDYLGKLSGALRQLAVDPSKSPAGEMVELRSWWEETAPIFKNMLPRTVQLGSRVNSETCWAQISRAGLTQTVFNLVQNAGDALSERGGVVTIWTDCNGEQVRVGVTDDGPGMVPEVKARCLEPFFTTKKRAISTGMGLSLVYGLVTDAGGTVHVDSEPGCGTTFILTFQRGDRSTEKSVRVGAGKVACIEVTDPRLRALVTSELRALSFDLKPLNATHAADVVILDDEAKVPESVASGVVLLNEVGAARPGLVAIGAFPSPKMIRAAVQRLLGGQGEWP